MHKGIKILLLLVPVLLAFAAAGGHWMVRDTGERLSLRRDSLRVRTDTCLAVMARLQGRDSLHRSALHADPFVRDSAPAPSGMDSLLYEAAGINKALRQTLSIAREAVERARFTPSICPLEEGTFHLSARFGKRTDPIEGDTRMHEGLDLACPQGNPVHVTADGTVEFIDNDIFGYGNSIIVNHGFGYKTRYAHLKIIRTSENIVLKRGDVIGETGVSGRATGPHLHYEVILNGEQVDPEDYMDLKSKK